MEEKKENLQKKKSSVSIEDRNRLMLTGVVEVICFNDEVITLDTNLGKLTIKGQELKVQKLDVQNGEVLIIGHINSCVYTTIQSKKDKESIIGRLFR